MSKKNKNRNPQAKPVEEKAVETVEAVEASDLEEVKENDTKEAEVETAEESVVSKLEDESANPFDDPSRYDKPPKAERHILSQAIQYIVLIIASLIYMIPILVIVINSLKTKSDISTHPFKLPTGDMFVGLENFKRGIYEIGFLKCFGYSLEITITSVFVIILFCSMTGWYITRVKTRITTILYYAFVFSMIVPFQMVMYTLSYITRNFPQLVIGETKIFELCSPHWLWIVYLGFGAGLSVFMFCGFVKAIPLEIEEAAMIDGCSPVKMFFSVVFPILKPTAITVAILNAMWIWNDYLLPNMLLETGYDTVPIAIQKSLRGSYGSNDMGALMAMLVLTVIPIILFYLVGQKYIIKGVVAGAVKG